MKRDVNKAVMNKVLTLCFLSLGAGVPLQWANADGLATDYDSLPPLLTS